MSWVWKSSSYISVTLVRQCKGDEVIPSAIALALLKATVRAKKRRDSSLMIILIIVPTLKGNVNSEEAKVR